MTYFINTSNPDGPWLKAIDPWTGLAIPGTRVDTCTHRIYQANTSRERTFYLSVDDAATDEFKAKYSLFVDPTPAGSPLLAIRPVLGTQLPGREIEQDAGDDDAEGDVQGRHGGMASCGVSGRLP